jgi:molybdopterin synthase sulfur carrier subunit
MSVSVLVPGVLTPYSRGRDTLLIEQPCATVADALAALAARLPALTDRVLTEQGEVRQHVNVFVGEESIRYTGGLATAVTDGATITIVPAVSGG